MTNTVDKCLDTAVLSLDYDFGYDKDWGGRDNLFIVFYDCMA